MSAYYAEDGRNYCKSSFEFGTMQKGVNLVDLEKIKNEA